VTDEADYERLAIVLAHDVEAMRAIRSHLADPLALPLFDNVRFTGELEALFAQLVERWSKGLPPAAIEAGC
jgi:predicted O-linked N-acetylglucosamine transferase (SPINDLY family)